jgi:phytoene synthase
MSGAATSKDTAAFCADLVRTHDFARYASTLFLPPVQRRALLAVYAFNVEISRVREQVSQPLPGEMRLQWWTDMLEGAGHGGVEGNPVAAELLQTIAEFRLPVEPLSRLIEEHQFDLYNDPMPSMAALEGYVTETASALFLLGARIAVPPSAVIDHLARHAGLAQGIAQVIATLPFDAARRQLFLPLQLLQQHGSGMEEVFAGKQTPRSISWRRTPESISARPSSCSRTYRHRRGRCSCRWRWSAATCSAGHVPTPIPSCRRRRRGCGPCGRCGARRGRGSLAGRSNDRHCERSEAIHLAASEPRDGLLRRCAPRNDAVRSTASSTRCSQN